MVGRVGRSWISFPVYTHTHTHPLTYSLTVCQSSVPEDEEFLVIFNHYSSSAYLIESDSRHSVGIVDPGSYPRASPGFGAVSTAAVVAVDACHKQPCAPSIRPFVLGAVCVKLNTFAGPAPDRFACSPPTPLPTLFFFFQPRKPQEMTIPTRCLDSQRTNFQSVRARRV